MNELRFACKLFSVTSSNETSTITEFRVPKRLCPQGLIVLWSACTRWNKVRSRNKTNSFTWTVDCPQMNFNWWRMSTVMKNVVKCKKMLTSFMNAAEYTRIKVRWIQIECNWNQNILNNQSSTNRMVDTVLLMISWFDVSRMFKN